ncbi:MFS transporter [Streptomyces sp. NPDC041068]|uniref:MFS transporter n=1 Tax=Streptomyces sp. NPDC041068 TaxID=3155130 RepID=UPI0033DAAE0F
MPQASPAVLPRGSTALFALAGGIAVANVYFAQPLLVALGDEFGISPVALGAIVTLTQVGYGLGLFFLVPLGDLLDPRRLITAQLLLLGVALLLVATATTAAVLLAGMAVVGLLAVVTQSLVACAASLARPERRGRVVGTVTSGIVVGILLARTVSGLLSDLAGWRSVYLTSAVLACAAAVALHRVVPPRQAAPPALGYGRLLASTVRLFAQERLLRLRALFALLVFASFSTLWSSVALALSDPPMSLSQTAIGAFGLLGAAGALAANAAGRLNDRGHANRTTGFGLALLVLSWLPLAFTRQSLWALAIGVILLDLAVQAVHVTNQNVIHALRPDAGSRLIGGYMVFYSIGSAAGAIAATALYSTAGWTAVCLLGAGFSGLALVFWAFSRNGATAAGEAGPLRVTGAAEAAESADVA